MGLCLRLLRLKSISVTGSQNDWEVTLVSDVDDVKVVINYDYSMTVEDYVHRIGRTGRSEATGTAYTFITDLNPKQAKELISVIEEAKQDVPSGLRALTKKSTTMSGKHVYIY